MVDAFKNDPTRVTHVAILAIFSVLPIIAVVFRFWARKIQRSALELSDYFIVAGLIWSVALTLFTIHSNVYWDLGGNVTQLGDPRAIKSLVTKQLKSLIIGQITWAVAVWCIRTSVLCLYIRIFRTKPFRIACYIAGGINSAFFVSIVLSALLLCHPTGYTWDKSIRNGRCGDQKALDLYIGIFNLLLDVTVVIMPMPVLWGLQMNLRRKVMLSGIFGMGIIICAITLIRTRISAQNHGSNSQKVYSLLALFTCLEALLGVTNACLPVLKPVLNKFSDSRASSWLSSAISGTITIFMRPSQMGSAWGSRSRTNPSQGQSRRSTWRRISINKHPMPEEKEMVRWHGTPTSLTRSPPPRYVDDKAAGMMFSSSPTTPYKAIQSRTRTRVHSDAGPLRPPVPPKSPRYSPVQRVDPGGDHPGVYFHGDWDVEKGISGENARDLMDIEKEVGRRRS